MNNNIKINYVFDSKEFVEKLHVALAQIIRAKFKNKLKRIFSTGNLTVFFLAVISMLLAVKIYHDFKQSKIIDEIGVSIGIMSYMQYITAPDGYTGEYLNQW